MTITDLGLGLPAHWYAVPAGADAGWSARLAQELVADASAAGQGSEASTARRAGSLAEDLGRVAAALAEPARDGALGAVLVRDPATGLADAMLAITVHRDVNRADYEEELTALVEAELDEGAVHGAVFVADVPAGEAHGAHVVSVREGADVEGALPELAERVVLGVFPHGSHDMVELLVMPDTMTTFADLAVAVTDLAQELRVAIASERLG